MDIGQIRGDLVAFLAPLDPPRMITVDDVGELMLTGYDDVPSSPELPCVYAGLPDSLREFSFAGSCIVDLSLSVCVSRADEGSAQHVLSRVLSTLMALPLPTGASFVDLAMTSVNNFRAASFGDVQVLAADINLSIRTT